MASCDLWLSCLVSSTSIYLHCNGMEKWGVVFPLSSSIFVKSCKVRKSVGGVYYTRTCCTRMKE